MGTYPSNFSLDRSRAGLQMLMGGMITDWEQGLSPDIKLGFIQVDPKISFEE